MDREKPSRGRREGRLAVRGLGTRLGASLVVLVLAFGMCVAAHAAGGARLADAGLERMASTGGSAIGILLDSTPRDQDENLIVNDSYLGVLLATAASKDVTVTFLLERPAEGAEERVYHTEVVGMGTPVPQPPDPVWPKEEGATDDYVFDVWCDEAGVAFNFATPVSADTRLYATWIKKDVEHKEVSVTLKGCGGVMPHPDDPAQTVGEYTTTKLAGAHYPLPDDPVRGGHTFQGWFTAEVGGTQVTGADTIGDADVTLYAQWKANTYRVCYHENHGSAPLSYTDPAVVTYDGTDVAFADWERVRTEGHFTKPDGMDLDGWCTTKDGTGQRFKAGDPIKNLTEVGGKVVDVYALWKKDGTVEEGPFDVTFYFNDGVTGPHVVKDVEKFGTVPEEDPVKAPKRTGYQFAGWYTDDGTFAQRWTFADQIVADTSLYAKWEVRLDVTVPVAVGFAVDAMTGEVTTPDVGRYALKSRTVVPVEVASFGTASEQADLEGFFSLADGAGWEDTLKDTALSVKSERAAGTIELPLAQGGPVGSSWASAHALTDAERADYALPAFSYAGVAFDETWAGADPSERLPLELGMRIPADKLEVRADLAGPVPITHLKVTVVAKG